MRASFRTGSPHEARLGCASLVAAGDRLFTSGLAAEESGSLESEARAVFAAAHALLRDAGSNLADAVRTRMFYVDEGGAAVLRRIHASLFGDLGPAMSTARVAVLPGTARVVLELEAVRNAGGRVRRHAANPARGSSLAVRVDGDIWVSGVTGEQPDGTVGCAGDHDAQAEVVVRTATDALSALGASPADVVAVRFYSLPEDGAGGPSGALAAFMAPGEPAAAGITMADLNAPGVRFLLEAEAVRGAAGTRRNVHTGRTYEAEHHYSRAVRVGDVVYVAGTTSIVVDEELRHPGEVGAQVIDTLETVRWAVEEEGLPWDSLVRTRSYVVGGPDGLADAAAALRETLGGLSVAATLVGVPVLGRPGVVIEIEATAVLDA